MTGNRVPSAGRFAAHGAIVAVAFVISFLEGYDLVSFGVTVPALLTSPGLGFTPVEVGIVGAVTPLGMLIGAAVSGATVARAGPRRLILTSVLVFSAGMLASAAAPVAGLFVVARALVGLGLGVALPTLLGYVADVTPTARRNRTVGVVMAGYALGGLAAPLLGALLLPHSSFRWIYAIGLLPALIAVPVAARLFPESPTHLLRIGRVEEAAELARTLAVPLPGAADASTRAGGGLRELLGSELRVTTLLFWATSACGLLLVFGLSTWLPAIMQAAGYPLGSALLLTAVTWTGAGTGMVLGGRVADRVGARAVVIAAFLAGAVGLLLIAAKPPVIVLLVLMFVSGFGFIGSQSLVNGFVLGGYPAAVRAQGLSWALTAARPAAMLGPLLGAWIAGSGLPVEANFFLFAAVGVLGAILAGVVPRRPAGSRAGSGVSVSMESQRDQ